eukprot:gene484-1129_t
MAEWSKALRSGRSPLLHYGIPHKLDSLFPERIDVLEEKRAERNFTAVLKQKKEEFAQETKNDLLLAWRRENHFICFGIQCNFGLFLRILVSSLKVGTASTAWLGSLAFGVTFFSSPFSNALCESFRPSHVSLIGVLFCAFGLLLSSFASNIVSLYLTYGLCFGIGSSMAYFPTVIALKKYFKRHLTLANGLSASGSGLGTLALGPLIEHCLDTVGLRLTYIVLSAVAASMLLTHIGFACAEGKIGAEDETAKLSHNLPGMGRFVKNLKALVLQKDLWKDGKYVFMVVSIAVFLFGYFVPYVHLVYLATTMGVPTMKATLLISYLSISSTVGKVFFGILINFTRIQVRAVTAISMLCIGLSNTLISHGTGYTSLCAYAVVIGLCEGCFTGQIATIVLETIGSKRMPSGLANLFAVNAVFMMAGPPFAEPEAMASDETSSISKGCFLFKPSREQTNGHAHGVVEDESIAKTKVRKRRQNKKPRVLFQGDKFPSLAGETSKQTEQRHDNFQKCWRKIFQQIESIQIEMNSKVFNDLLHFVKKSCRNDAIYFPQKEIPTAALLTGMNMPDHEVIFNKITSDLEKDVTPYVVLLHSKDCSNPKSLLRELLTQLMTSEHDDVEQNLDKSFIEDVGKIKHFTLSVLQAWYTENTKTSNDAKPPVVIIFEDFERFHRPVLQDFIQISSGYMESMPIVMIFALATTISAVHKSLPHSVSSRLSIEKFQAQPSLECLHEILNEVFLTSEHPFKLGPKMSNLLFDRFLLQDFSIQNFANAVQFSMLEHFYNNPLSILCSDDSTALNATVGSLSKEHLSCIRKSKSFLRYCDRKSLSEQNQLKADDRFLKETIKDMVEDLHRLKRNLFPLINCLHFLTMKLPGSPFGKRLKNVYEYGLRHEITKSDIYQNSLLLIKQTSRDELLSAMQNCAFVIKKAIDRDGSDTSFDEILENLNLLIRRFDSLDAQTMEQKDKKGATTNASKATAKIPTYKNRFELQERMRQAVKEKKATPYDNLRSDIVDFWDKIFRRYLLCPTKLPLHEVTFFDNVDAVAPHINATPMSTIQTALRDPNYYLKAFASVADPSSSSARRNSKKRQADDEKLQYPFIQ